MKTLLILVLTVSKFGVDAGTNFSLAGFRCSDGLVEEKLTIPDPDGALSRYFVNLLKCSTSFNFNLLFSSICQGFTVQVDEVETEGKVDDGKFLFIEYSLTELPSDEKNVSITYDFQYFCNDLAHHFSG